MRVNATISKSNKKSLCSNGPVRIPALPILENIINSSTMGQTLTIERGVERGTAYTRQRY